MSWSRQYAIAIVLATLYQTAASIDCYTCSSLNDSTPGCHDPFDASTTKYVKYCMVGKEGHTGLFPAQFCVKLIGKSVQTQVELVIRVCALESMDNSCGEFKYQDELMQGCILTCEHNGCNAAPSIHTIYSSLATLLYLLLIAFAFAIYSTR